MQHYDTYIFCPLLFNLWRVIPIWIRCNYVMSPWIRDECYPSKNPTKDLQYYLIGTILKYSSNLVKMTIEVSPGLIGFAFQLPTSIYPSNVFTLSHLLYTLMHMEAKSICLQNVWLEAPCRMYFISLNETILKNAKKKRNAEVENRQHN